MRRGKLLGFAVLALLAFATALVSSAYGALLENLPEKPGRNFTGNSLGSISPFTILGSNTIISCLSAPATGTEASSKPPSGTIHIDILDCGIAQPIKGKCTGLGEPEGTILGLLDWELVFDTNPTGTLTTAVLFTVLSDIHALCAGLVLIVIKAGGQVICLHLNPTEKSKLHEYTCLLKENILGDPLETKYWNSAGTEKSITELLTSVSGGAFTMSAQQGVGMVETTEEIVADQ
jgi:hypothetical protein